jgi:tripartite-type tricarboxylate transporter receptor subunit TctC
MAARNVANREVERRTRGEAVNGMKLERRRFLRLAAGAAALPAAPGIVRAQSYPSRAITAVVAFAAGGSGDTIARILADHMRKTLGQTIVIENVGGAAGTIGVGRVARAAPDGYTLIFGNWPTHVLNGAIYPLQYHVLDDFEPIAMLATESIVIVGKKALPPNNLRELIAWLKANPNKASAGTTGAGGVGHVIGLFFQKETGTQFQFVPYRGVGPAMQDLVAGQIELMFDTSANSLPQARAGTIKGFAVTSKARLASAPNIPAVDEAGLPNFHISNWRGLWAPKGTPKDVVAKLNDAVVRALADPGVSKRLADLGQEIPPRDQQTPEALASYQKADIERWWPVIKAANIKPN